MLLSCYYQVGYHTVTNWLVSYFVSHYSYEILDDRKLKFRNRPNEKKAAGHLYCTSNKFDFPIKNHTYLLRKSQR